MLRSNRDIDMVFMYFIRKVRLSVHANKNVQKVLKEHLFKWIPKLM